MPTSSQAIAIYALSITLAASLAAQETQPEAPPPEAPPPATEVGFGFNSFGLTESGLPELRTDADGRIVLQVTPRLVRLGEPFVLAAGEHQLTELIDQAAEWLGRNYLTTATDFEQPNLSFTLQTELHLDADGLERVLNLALYTRGFAIVTLSEDLRLYQVIAMSGPQRAEILSRARQASPEEILESADRMEQVMTVLELEHINAVMASTATRPFFAQASGGFTSLMVGNLGDSHSMLLQGWAPQVAQAIRLLRLADAAAGRAAERERIQSLEERLEKLEQRGAPSPASAASAR